MMGDENKLGFRNVLIVSASIQYRRGLAEALLRCLPRPKFSVIDPQSRPLPDHSHDWTDIDLVVIDLSKDKLSVRSWFFDYPNKDIVPPMIFIDSQATVDDAGDMVRAGAADYIDIRGLKRSRLSRALVIASAMVTARIEGAADGQYTDMQATKIIDVIESVNTDDVEGRGITPENHVFILDDPEATGLLPAVSATAITIKETQLPDPETPRPVRTQGSESVDTENPATEVLPQIDIKPGRRGGERSDVDRDRVAMAAMGILTEEVPVIEEGTGDKRAKKLGVGQTASARAGNDQMMATGLMSILEKNRIQTNDDHPAAVRESKSMLMGQRWPFTHGDIEQGKASIGGYKIEEFIGVGGTASVFKVSRKSDERVFAMKLFDTDSPDNLGRDRFSRGYQLLQSIKHPNVCSIEELVNSGEHTFVILEYLPCGDLRSRINAGIGRDEAVRYATQIGAALYAAHRLNIIHRDLKPSNILFRSDDSLALVDFGIAKQMAEIEQQMTQRGQVVGTPYYISPEQATGESVDHRSDLYALGVMMYEMLEGRRPYEGETSMQIMTAHVHNPIPHLSNKGDALNGVVSRLLSKDPEERFPSGKDLVLALKSICPNGVSLETLKTVI